MVSWSKSGDSTYKGDVSGSNEENYNVHIDKLHPRKSVCNCSIAGGRRVVCKHMIALFFYRWTGATKGIKVDKLKHFTIPLPLLAKQKRTVAKLEDLLLLYNRLKWGKVMSVSRSAESSLGCTVERRKRRSKFFWLRVKPGAAAMPFLANWLFWARDSHDISLSSICHGSAPMKYTLLSISNQWLSTAFSQCFYRIKYDSFNCCYFYRCARSGSFAFLLF